MSVLSAQSILLNPPLSPLLPRTQHPESGCSFGLSSCGYDIRLDQDVELKPGEFCLASTIEKFHMPTSIVGIVHDKSTWIRRGLCVFNTVVEPGWSGHLTLELKNVSNEMLISFDTNIPNGGLTRVESEDENRPGHTLKLVAGTPIAQVIFSWLDAPTDQPYEGKYQHQERGPVAARDGKGHK